jgi:hypothetical protein
MLLDSRDRQRNSCGGIYERDAGDLAGEGARRDQSHVELPSSVR